MTSQDTGKRGVRVLTGSSASYPGPLASDPPDSPGRQLVSKVHSLDPTSHPYPHNVAPTSVHDITYLDSSGDLLSWLTGTLGYAGTSGSALPASRAPVSEPYTAQDTAPCLAFLPATQDDTSSENNLGLYSTDAGMTLLQQMVTQSDMVACQLVSIRRGVLAAAFGVGGAREHFKNVAKLDGPLNQLACLDDQQRCGYLFVYVSSSGDMCECTATTYTKRSLVPFDILYDASCGAVVKQVLHLPCRRSSYTTNVVKAKLDRPTWFKRNDGCIGVSLQQVLVSGRNLDDLLDSATTTPNVGEGQTKVIAIHVEGKRVFEHQIRTAPKLATYAQLLRNVAAALQHLFAKTDREEYCGKIVQESVTLLGCAHVSKGRLQVIFSV